jgi:DNA-binding response OmpR family regulator
MAGGAATGKGNATSMTSAPPSLLLIDSAEARGGELLRGLKREGYAVTAVADQASVEDLLAVEQYDLVLIDPVLPDADGYRILGALRANPTSADLPVIVVTAAGDRDSVWRCAHLGVEDYILKPYDLLAVKTRIWRCLENRRLRRRLAAVGPEAPTADTRVLVVDDNGLNRQVLSMHLEHMGYRVDSVASGSETLEWLQKERADLLALDIMMPEMDGFELLGHIRSAAQYGEPAVVMISAVDDVAAIERCMQLGADDYITKPFQAAELAMRLPSCLELRRLQRREAAREQRLRELVELGRSIDRRPATSGGRNPVK